MNNCLLSYVSRNDFEIVSFDIFDTLVERKYKSPSDVFFVSGSRILGENNADRYRFDRIKAEQLARSKKKSREVTIQEIFSELPITYRNYEDLLLKEEIKEELDCCSVNESIKQVYDLCISLQKKVVIISDMYLPKNVLVEMLNNCNYSGYQNIYVSNEYDASKRDGSLFGIVINNEKILNGKALHIGDSFKADYISAMKNGFKAYWVPRKQIISRKIYEKSIRSKYR